MEYDVYDRVCQDANGQTVQVSYLIADPFVRRAFACIERDNGAAPVAAIPSPTSPVLSGGAMVEA